MSLRLLPARRSLVGALVLATALAACVPVATTGGKGPAGPNEALAGLPQLTDPPLALDDDDDLQRARQLYDALPESDPGRPARRAELWKAYQLQIEADIAAADVAGTAEAFEGALGMWTPAELADETRPAPGLDAVAPMAEKLADFYSRAGRDVEAVTALAVERAAWPDKGAQYQNAYDAIVAYADDLEVARLGPGAERARPIAILEEVTSHFASPWACRLLAGMYLDRQAARVAQLGKNDQNMEAAHGPGIRFPVWNLIRAYARMGKLEQVPDLADTLAGQVGDDAELRRVLRDAFKPGSNAEVFSALAGGFTGDQLAGEKDLVTARRICETGLRLAPHSPEPHRCLGLVAAQGGSAQLAIQEIEAAFKLSPKDAKLAGLLASLYNFRLGDALRAERPQAAHADLARLEKLYADAAKQWPGKPLEPGLDETYFTMGRGLYALGEIDGALEWLHKAHAMKPNPEALEMIALIEHKRGRHADAARDFEAAAALPRETPLQKRVDEARLLRLAADSRAAAGDTAGAASWYKAALDKWDVVLGSGLTEVQRTEALLERGRIIWALGGKADALHSLEAAIDSTGDSTQSSVFSDVIAFLVPRGEYDAALDAYHRGIARKGVTEYFKIYCSLWVVAGARLRGLEPDPLALEFLASRSGTRWYHDLARFTVGKLSWDELYKKANTRGKRAEAFYYQGLARYQAGDKPGGDKLMRLVISTDMLGFFEYDMAAYLLAHGPPGGPAAK
jgi:tetratricopeptide (TPR) repeat protein